MTLGSPLTHSEFLIASDLKDLEMRKQAREMPICPPYREALAPGVLDAAIAAGGLPIADPPQDTRLASFRDFAQEGRWMLHHAAPFALVRWTNIHDPSRFVYQGDIIGGPLAETLGAGIEDVDLRSIRGQATWFSHSAYWQQDEDARQLAAVRSAINLLDD